jgi:ribosome biogenesis GTPase
MGASEGQMQLADLGWTQDRAAAFRPHALAGLIPGRVVSSGGATIAVTGRGSVEVILQRRFRRDIADGIELPAVGDWLALGPVSQEPPLAALRTILPRTGTFTRNQLSVDHAQLLAANVDVAFLVTGLDHDLNLRRLERYLVLAFGGGVTPVVVLNKSDIALDLEAAVGDVHRIAAGTRVVVASAVVGTGIEELRSLLPPGTTGCLLGSSGVGKSSITNALLGEDRQVVRELREDDSKGRHTTTRRELFSVPGAGLLIDTPGLRTVGVLADEAGLAASFADVDGLARRCRFNDCRHAGEPGCMVQVAIEQGDLDADRLASHRKLEAERRYLERREDVRARRAAERRFGRLVRDAATAAKYRHGEDRASR